MEPKLCPSVGTNSSQPLRGLCAPQSCAALRCSEAVVGSGQDLSQEAQEAVSFSHHLYQPGTEL